MADEDSDNMQVTLSARTLIIGAFALGLTTGMFGGLLTANSLTGSAGDSDSGGQNTAKISGSPKEVFTQLAGDVGADKQEFQQCYSESKGEEYKEDMRNIQEIAGRLGTPTFFIGNDEIGYQIVSGAQPVAPKQQTKSLMGDDIEQQLQEARNGNTNISDNEVSLENISLDSEPTQGSSDALINVIEYSDYGCPFCSEWAGYDASSRIPIDTWGIKENLQKTYVNSGEVQFVYKDFPVPDLHPNAPKAHKAANCVLEQDESLYWKFHDKLFEFQSSWKR